MHLYIELIGWHLVQFLVHFCHIRIGKNEHLPNIELILKQVQTDWNKVKLSANECKWGATKYNQTAPTPNKSPLA